MRGDTKTSPKTKKTTSVKRTTKKDKEMEKILIENFIAMQKVMTKQAEQFDKLTHQISSLLHLFEDSAKALTQKEINLEMKEPKEQKEILNRLGKVLEQNKIIAKGLTLMHETAVNPSTHYTLAPNPESIKQSQPITSETSIQNPLIKPQQKEEIITPTKSPQTLEENSTPEFRGF